jgi:hypothetical protein
VQTRGREDERVRGGRVQERGREDEREIESEEEGGRMRER